MYNSEAAAEERMVEAADAMVTYLLQKRMGQPADELRNLQLARRLKSATDQYIRAVSAVRVQILTPQ